MASFDDLGQALRDDAAAHAPDVTVIDVDAVTRAARTRRRPRLVGAGALALIGAVGLGGVAVAAVTSPTLIAASESAGGDDLLLAEEGAADEGAGAPTTSGDERLPSTVGCDGLPSAPGDGVSGLAAGLELPAGVGGVRVTGVSCADGAALEPGAYTVVIELELIDPASGGTLTVTGPPLPLRLD